MEYYKEYIARYMLASEELRKAAKEHWTKCHMKNLASGRDDLIIFSAKMLSSIATAEYLIAFMPV